MPALPIDTVQSAPLQVDTLPGEPLPYYMSRGEGERFETGGQLWTVIARPQDNGGEFDAAFVDGPRGAGSPLHAVPEAHRTFYVFSGEVDVVLGDQHRRLSRGDSIHVPGGVAFAYRFRTHVTQMLYFAAPGGTLEPLLNSSAGTSKHIYSPAASADELILPAGATRLGEADWQPVDVWDSTRPTGEAPYTIRGFEGDHLAWPDTLNSLFLRPENTGGRYFGVHTFAGSAPYIIRHFHEKHTETFFAVAGRIWLWVNGREVLLTEGDFLSAPAGTVHSFAIGSHKARMLGFLTTGVFAPFFDVTSVVTDDVVYSEGLIDPSVLMGGIQQNPDLDLVVAGPPPERTLAPEL